jgi:hypothetical protein
MDSGKRMGIVILAALAALLMACGGDTPVPETPSPEPRDCSLANAFPPEEAELIWPTLREVQPAPAAPGDEVQIRGTGGFLYWNNECGEFRNESARDFALSFDGRPVGSINCYAHTCLATLTLPADATPGQHTLSVEGGSTLEIEVSPSSASPPP